MAAFNFFVYIYSNFTLKCPMEYHELALKKYILEYDGSNNDFELIPFLLGRSADRPSHQPADQS